MSTDKKRVTIRLNPGLHEILRKQAADANRSLNSYVELLLTKGVQKIPTEKQLRALEFENRLRGAFHQLKQFKEGKIKLKTMEEMLQEL